MNSLPTEILETILVTHLPPSAYTAARLTCRTFNTILTPFSFPLLALFADTAMNGEAKLQALVQRHASEAQLRRSSHVIWSPHCSVPQDLVVPEGFLLALHAGLRGRSWCAPRGATRADEWDGDSGYDSESGSEENDLKMELSGAWGHDDKMLKEILFRYVLCLSYRCEDMGEAPHRWVLDPKL